MHLYSDVAVYVATFLITTFVRCVASLRCVRSVALGVALATAKRRCFVTHLVNFLHFGQKLHGILSSQYGSSYDLPLSFVLF